MNYTIEALENDLHVKNEEELKNAINNTSNKKATTINIDNDITLTETLKIPTNKNITLTSNKITEYYKLIGAEYKSTIFVDKDSTLKIDGVIVTHIKTAISAGGGIYVEENGLLILYSGEISNNEAVDHGSPFSPGASGGGVCNRGVFEMYGGKISGNQVYGLGSSGGGSGGGVFNTGIFTMTGGEITNNVANVYGGGVFNTGIFTMTGGEITNNIAENWGGGVSTFGTFEWLGGVISGNTAKISGNNVYPDDYDSETSNGGSNNSNNNGSSTDKVELSEGGFTLREVVFMCVGVGGLVIGVVGVILFFTSKKELEYIKKKNKLTNDNS
ncbi:MAG: hypothetical protein FWH37_10130 [Candidatus Bathyarchaeota archaeon]|nr:hypothetical protein [Candidatus Termiticorpusculum sp.]